MVNASIKQNYDTLFCKEIERIQGCPLFATKKPSLLLHVCCAPCSSAVLERLAEIFDISVYFYNPNIHPEEEYYRRLAELEVFLQKGLSQALYGTSEVPLIKAPYVVQDFFSAVQTEKIPERKTEQERGHRCQDCYHLRITKTALFATEKGYDYFTTALSISPHKDAHIINSIGMALEQQLLSDSASSLDNPSSKSLRYLYADFKKQNGYKRSLELSKQFGLYRQDYCGCVFSQR